MANIADYYKNILKDLNQKISLTTPEKERIHSEQTKFLAAHHLEEDDTYRLKKAKALHLILQNTGMMTELSGELRNIEYCLNFLIDVSSRHKKHSAVTRIASNSSFGINNNNFGSAGKHRSASAENSVA